MVTMYVPFLCATGIIFLQAAQVSTQETWNYTEALHDSFLFYEAQRSGRLPPSNRIPWRSNSMLNDGNDVNRDLTGGYFDGGDFMKYNFPMAYTVTVLAWGGIDYQSAYEKSGEWTNLLSAVRWATDYFIKCHPSENEYYGQVGNTAQDRAVWTRPEDWEKAGHPQRPAYKISSADGGADLAGETAAAMAAASILFHQVDLPYSTTLLTHAQRLYTFANQHRVVYTKKITDAQKYYNSSGFSDELLWAAIWLFRATNSTEYRNAIDSHLTTFEELSNRPEHFDYDDKRAGAQVLLAEILGEGKFKAMATAFCDYVAHWHPRTLLGMLSYRQFASLPLAVGSSFICLHVANKLNINRADYQKFGREQVGIALGDTQGMSYLVGFGVHFAIKPVHRGSSCPTNLSEPCDEGSARFSPAPNPNVLTGALVAGPGSDDKYVDSRLDEAHNPVAIAWNACFTSALAAILGAPS